MKSTMDNYRNNIKYISIYIASINQSLAIPYIHNNIKNEGTHEKHRRIYSLENKQIITLTCNNSYLTSK